MKESAHQYQDTFEKLRSRINELENENRLLKERMDEAGVSYADIVAEKKEMPEELYDPDQGARIKRFVKNRPRVFLNRSNNK